MFDMRRELYDKLQNQEVAYYDRNPVGRIMTRLTSDVDSLNELFTAGITDLLGDVVMIFAIIGAMLWMDVRLTFVTLLTVPMLWAATTWFRIGARKGYDMVRTRIARINAFLQEHFAGAQTVQIFNAETKSVTKFREINADYRKANIDTIFYYAVFFPLVDLIGAAGVALIIWYGGYRVMQNTPGHTVLTLGALVAFIQYSSFLFQPIRDISDKYNVLQAAVVASHRIFKTLDLPIAITSPARPRKSGRAEGRLEFENVWFAYKDEDWILKDVSFKVDPGQSIALVGHTGSGKSTITNLLMRFYDVQRGRILLLDEATSSIDTETEQLIQQAIERVMRDRTSIVVAHRLSTIQRADQIIVLHHGEIRERGTHQELLAQHGLYWKLYKLQYSDKARPTLPDVLAEEEVAEPAGQAQFSE